MRSLRLLTKTIGFAHESGTQPPLVTV